MRRITLHLTEKEFWEVSELALTHGLSLEEVVFKALAEFTSAVKTEEK